MAYTMLSIGISSHASSEMYSERESVAHMFIHYSINTFHSALLMSTFHESSASSNNCSRVQFAFSSFLFGLSKTVAEERHHCLLRILEIPFLSCPCFFERLRGPRAWGELRCLPGRLVDEGMSRDLGVGFVMLASILFTLCCFLAAS